MKQIVITLLASIFLIGCGGNGNSGNKEIKAFYGDPTGINGEGSRTVVIDVKNMQLLASNPSLEGPTSGAHSANQAGSTSKLYVDTRATNSLEILDSVTNQSIGTIPLEHHPRSQAFNETLGLQLVTGSDKPMASLIDVKTDTVVATAGDNNVYPPNGDYGGGNATGHPFWFDDHRFAIIDRPNRLIYVYEVKKQNGMWITQLLSTVKTETTVHLLINRGNKQEFFAIAEGSGANGLYPPMVLKYRLDNNGTLTEESHVDLTNPNVDIKDMGAHHGDLDPTNGKLLYVGSTEGNMYIVNLDTMKIETSIPVGKGAGHTSFVPKRGIAIVTNHKDTFVSVIDMKKLKLIKNIVVSGPQKNGESLQAHSHMVDPNQDFYYAFASDNGIFFEINLETLKVSRTLDTGGTPVQGIFMCDGVACSERM